MRYIKTRFGVHLPKTELQRGVHRDAGVQQPVLHGERSQSLAPPRNTKDKKNLQSTQSTVNRHTS